MRKPDFKYMLQVFERKVPDKPVLFELFLNERTYKTLAAGKQPVKGDNHDRERLLACAYRAGGYDYLTVMGSWFGFAQEEKSHKDSLSLNESTTIPDRAAFNSYKWNDPEAEDYSWMEGFSSELPEGMKLVVMGPGGVLENVISLVGYDNLCLMLYDDPDLVGRLFNEVGSRLVRYYELSAKYDSVGAVISNDDWGFNTQTMLSVDDMRKYVFPWHKKIVEVSHKAGKPVILHSCGRPNEVIDDIIYSMKYDARHSYEDNIFPVEDFYEQYHSKIAVMGGMDVNFICTSTNEEIEKRSKAMLERVKDRGGYALGTGNSVPEFISDEKYFAMIDTVRYCE